MLVALVRFTLAGVFFLPAFLVLHRGEQRFTAAERPRVWLLAVVGVAGSMVSYLLGLRTVPATDAAIYNLTTSLFMLLWARLFFGERLSRPRLGRDRGGRPRGVGPGDGRLERTGGGARPGGGVVRAGQRHSLERLHDLQPRDHHQGRPPLLVLSAVNLIAMVTVWLVAVPFGTWAEVPGLLHWSAEVWWGMAYLVVLMSVFSHFLFTLSIRDLHPSRVARPSSTRGRSSRRCWQSGRSASGRRRSRRWAGC